MTINKHTTATDISNTHARTQLEYSPQFNESQTVEELESKEAIYVDALEKRLGKNNTYVKIRAADLNNIADGFYRSLKALGDISFYDYEAIMLRLDELVRAGAIIK